MKDKNCEEWAEEIEMAFESKNKLGFIDGTISHSLVRKVEIRRWKKINTLIGSWILKTIEPSLRSLIKKTKAVKILWDELL